MKHIKRLNKTRKAVAITIIASMLISTGIPVYGIKSADAEGKNTKIVNSTNQKRNVMYYGDWSIWGGQGNFYPKDIPADQLTHLNFAFMDFDSNGNLVFTDKDAAVGAPVGQEGVQWGAPNAGILIALQQLREENPNLKLGISLGGWSKSADFPIIAADPGKRTNFINNVIKFVEYTNMDFVDLDWEFAGEVRQPDKVDNKNDEGNPHATKNDKENYIKLLEEFRVALDKKGVELGKKYELTVALPAPKQKVDIGIDVDRLFNVVDFANIMTYDMRGAWDEYSGHQTGLYSNPNEPLKGNNLSIDESVDYLIEKGAESEKIVIGAAYYTRGWDKVSAGPDASLPGLFGEAEISTKDADQTPSRGAINEAPLTVGDGGRMSGVWSYRNIDKLKANYPGLKEYWDDTAKAPYLYDESTGKFFTYDNKRSIEEKTKYVNENNLGGVIGWMQSQDAPTTSTKRDELTKATKEGLFGNADLAKYEVVYSELDIDATVTPYEIEWGTDRKGYEITIRNNEKADESNEVLKEVERGSETIKAPKLYLKTDKPLNRGDHMAGTVTYENGYTVVDLKSVWEGKNIEQGQSYTLKLSGDAKIESIELAQRMSNNSPDMYKQTIYGEATNPEQNQAPVFNGVTNKTIKVGENFDKMAGVTASDKEDGDLTYKIKVLGNIDTATAGKYELTYTVQDSKGLESVAKRTITVEAVTTQPDYDFGVGQGIQWPAQVNAPFADMTAWNNGDFSNNGALNLKKIATDTGVKFFNLGFIQSTGGVSNGKVNWGWGGFDTLNEKNKDNTQYQGIKKAIKDIREMGGDVTISLGGLNGVAFWEATQDVDTLYNTYKEIVEGYGLTRLDLDIEGGATNKAHNIANAKAIKKVQDETGVDIVLTLAVLPSGLTSVQLDVLEAYLSQGVDVELVNIMTMCYGNGTLLPGENYGTASIRAVDSTKDQLKEYFKRYANIELSDAKAYRKIGTTPSVGFEGEAHPTFGTDWTKLVVGHAIEKGIGMTSMWSINRDSMAQPNKGITAAYEHTNLFKKFGSDEGTLPEVNQAPVLKGVEDKTINKGESFDKLAGVTATDAEDGDLTSGIVVNGDVDTNKAGKYTLNYSVTDSKGKTTTKSRIITVKDSSIIEDTYDPNKIYLGGEVVIYKGQEYKAKWWTQGEAPGKSQAWEKIVKPNEDGSVSYEPGMVFTGGQTVKYEGKIYKAKWWTNSIPGSDSSWELIG